MRPTAGQAGQKGLEALFERQIHHVQLHGQLVEAIRGDAFPEADDFRRGDVGEEHANLDRPLGDKTPEFPNDGQQAEGAAGRALTVGPAAAEEVAEVDLRIGDALPEEDGQPFASIALEEIELGARRLIEGFVVDFLAGHDGRKWDHTRAAHCRAARCLSGFAGTDRGVMVGNSS